MNAPRDIPLRGASPGELILPEQLLQNRIVIFEFDRAMGHALHLTHHYIRAWKRNYGLPDSVGITLPVEHETFKGLKIVAWSFTEWKFHGAQRGTLFTTEKRYREWFEKKKKDLIGVGGLRLPLTELYLSTEPLANQPSGRFLHLHPN